MSDVAAVLVSLAAGVIANFVSFFALQAFDRGNNPAVIRVERQSVIIEWVRIEGPLRYEISERKVIISETTFVLRYRQRTRLHLLASVAIALVSFAVLVGVLVF